jgi:ribonuclease Z
MQVRVFGCGEASDSGVGNNGFLLTGQGSGATARILIDCGYQTPERLWADGLHRGLNAIYLTHTHTHADHGFGVVPLLTRYWEERRTRFLTIIGHRGVCSYITKLMNLGFKLVSSSRPLAWGGLTFRTGRSQHGVMNLSV